MLRWWVFVLAGVMVMEVAGQQRCTEQRTCAECIQTPGCRWCSKFTGTSAGQPEGEVIHHCQDQSFDMTICEEGHLENPVNEANVTRDDPLTDINKKATRNRDKIIQISPQKMKLRLRKGVSQRIDINFRLATDYPVDLYYLMDLSSSMSDDKDNVAHVGFELAELLSNLTSQYRLGFGSFVDKVLMPYVDTSPQKINSPCRGCVAPYSFINHLPLNNDNRRFTEAVRNADISGNMDSPEGGFDALMQAMVCDQIGWSEEARKIVVFSTDAKFHYAGSGRVSPNLNIYSGYQTGTFSIVFRPICFQSTLLRDTCQFKWSNYTLTMNADGQGTRHGVNYRPSIRPGSHSAVSATAATERFTLASFTGVLHCSVTGVVDPPTNLTII